MEATTTQVHQSPRLIAEVDPPKGTNLQRFLDTALKIRGRVDRIRVTDNEHAILRMSPLAPSWALKERGSSRPW